MKRVLLAILTVAMLFSCCAMADTEGWSVTTQPNLTYAEGEQISLNGIMIEGPGYRIDYSGLKAIVSAGAKIEIAGVEYELDNMFMTASMAGNTIDISYKNFGMEVSTDPLQLGESSDEEEDDDDYEEIPVDEEIPLTTEVAATAPVLPVTVDLDSFHVSGTSRVNMAMKLKKTTELTSDFEKALKSEDCIIFNIDENSARKVVTINKSRVYNEKCKSIKTGIYSGFCFDYAEEGITPVKDGYQPVCVNVNGKMVYGCIKDQNVMVIDVSKCTLMRVGSNGLNLRPTPTTKYEPLFMLDEGEFVLLLASANDWSLIITKDGILGYVKTEFLKTVNPADGSVNIVCGTQTVETPSDDPEAAVGANAEVIPAEEEVEEEDDADDEEDDVETLILE